MVVHDVLHRERHSDRSLNAAISDAVVGVVRDCTGRGPTKARTTICGDTVLVMLEDTLTQRRANLGSRGRGDKVLDPRSEYQEVMRAEASAVVAGLTGRAVIAMMSAHHIDPDLAAEIFLLDGPPEASDRGPAEEGAGTGHQSVNGRRRRFKSVERGDPVTETSGRLGY
ncbi:MAG: DUF2294 family protein [Solirubrobacterales bacterium]|nr:DUF2294 family protein [Solirubrobacterales bacterium]